MLKSFYLSTFLSSILLVGTACDEQSLASVTDAGSSGGNADQNNPGNQNDSGSIVSNEAPYGRDIGGDPLPPGVTDDVGLPEDQDRDGYCYEDAGEASGYYKCDDGAPPGTGRPSRNGTGTTPGGSGGTGICIDESFTASENRAPRVLIVLDKSGSMEENAIGFNGSKWNGAVNAVTSLVNSLDSQMDFGLMLYPAGNQQTCDEGEVNVSVEANQATTIVDRLSYVSPIGGTPTAPTLVKAKIELDSLSDSGGNRAVIIVTDGAPNCNENLPKETCICTVPNGCAGNGYASSCLDNVDTIAAAQAANAAGYSVFVVGIPGSENFSSVLNAMATAGGTAQAGTNKYYDASSTQSLEASLSDIATRLSSCRFDLADQVNDTENVNVTIDGTVISLDASRQNGFDIMDGRKTIELFGQACLIAAGANSVKVNYCHD